MNLHDILLPVFVQVALTFWLLIWMARSRFAAIGTGEVRREDVSMGQRAWPPAAQRASNAYSNQFELPVLYFALVPLVIITRKADLLFVVMSWIFVLSRLIHAAVYVFTTGVPARFGAFLIGVIVLLAMWISFALRILATPLPA